MAFHTLFTEKEVMTRETKASSLTTAIPLSPLGLVLLFCTSGREEWRKLPGCPSPYRQSSSTTGSPGSLLNSRSSLTCFCGGGFEGGI